jgi:hypothetical protein
VMASDFAEPTKGSPRNTLAGQAGSLPNQAAPVAFKIKQRRKKKEEEEKKKKGTCRFTLR